MNAIYSGLLFSGAALLCELIMNAMFASRPESMEFSWAPVGLWFVFGLLSSFVRERLSIVMVLVIFGFYCIGNLNAVASYYQYGRHYLTDLRYANLVYIVYATAFVSSMLFYQHIFPPRTPVPYTSLRFERIDTVFFLGAMVFPLVWLLEELIVLRRVPILSGESIVNEMYATQYGRLYGYGILLGVSALLMWSKLRSFSWEGRGLLLIGLLISVFAMVFDGRRVFLLAFLGAIFAYEISGFPDRKLWKPVLKFVLALLSVYVVILYARQGGQLITYPSPAQIFSKVGVEYRDFAYVVTHIKPGALPGYSWLGSAVGGFGNWLFLALFGLDKNELVFSGSAYQLAAFYRSSFGIRIGLIPEIWLQYGLLGSLFCLPVAALYVWIARLVEQAQSEVGRVLASMAFGVALLSFLGQASAITGYWSLIFYLSLAWLFFDQFRRKTENAALSR